jgi:hypothetical protein
MFSFCSRQMQSYLRQYKIAVRALGVGAGKWASGWR